MTLRPSLHFTAPKNWINDPNGLSYYKGEYHLFYQHNPENCYWGNMTWGHATSTELFDWNNHPFALVPGVDMEEDRDGCFSGSAFQVGEELHLAYTGVVFENKKIDDKGNPHPTDDQFISTQLFAKSSDGFNFEKNQDIKLTVPEGHESRNFRDPKVWKKGDTWYMVIGSALDGKGTLLVYTSKNLKEWVILNEIISDNLGFMWECPDLFEIENKHAFIFSPMGAGKTEQKNIAGYTVGDFDYSTGELDYDKFYLLDEGFEYYAPQTFVDDKGRRILIGWMFMCTPLPGEEWSGMMSLPRVVHRNGDKLRFEVAEEYKQYLTLEREIEKVEDTIVQMESNSYEINVDFNSSISNEIKLLGDKNGRGLKLNYNNESKRFTLDRSDVINGLEQLKVYGCRRESSRIEGENISLKIIVDKSIVEIYINNGETVMSAVVNPNENQTIVTLEGKFNNYKEYSIKK